MSRAERWFFLIVALGALALQSESAAAASPSIVSATISKPTTTTVTLEAEINPEGKSTKYHFEYGLEECASNACVSTPSVTIEKGSSPEHVEALIEGLAPGTSYHFRVVAKNGDGATEGPDRIFATFALPPSFQPCSNDGIRSGHPSAQLPDCRAYEQASPVDKNGTDAGGNIFHVQASLSGDAVTFMTNSGVPGGVGAQEFPDYLARRQGAQWSTQGLLPPPSFGERANVVGWTPDLAYVFDSATHAGGFDNALLLRNSSDGTIRELMEPTAKAAYSFVAASADDSKIFFEVKGAELDPLAAAGRDNLYVFDRDTGAVSLVGILPESDCGSPPCAPPNGSFAGPYDWWGGTNDLTLQRGGAAGDASASDAPGYFTEEENAISAMGDKAYFTAGGTGQVYLRKGIGGAAETVPVSKTRKTNGSGPGGVDAAGVQPAAFMEASADGSLGFFTSTEKLTNDATTGPEPPAPAIARSNLDGTAPDQSFLPAHASAAVVDGSYVYWASPEEDAIGRAKIDGTEVEEEFIAGADNPQGIAVDSEYVYWTNAPEEAGIGEGKGSIGRARLNGTEVDQSFIGGASGPRGIDVDPAHVYWINANVHPLGGAGPSGAVARAKIDGKEAENELILVANGDVAVNGERIYYSRVNAPESGGNGFIRRANLDGTGAENVEGPNEILSGSKEPPALALDGSHLYFTNPANSVIGRAGLDGNGAEKLIEGAGHPHGLAVGAAHIYWSANQEVVPNPGRDLYRYDAADDELTDLTVDTSDPNGAEVQGVVGASADGAYVYFVANGDLDGSGPAAPGSCKRSGGGRFDYTGFCNLYLVHEGDFTFVARLDASGGGIVSDAANWQPNPARGANFKQVSTGRVSVDGRTVLFRSQRALGPYESEGVPELYRFQLGDAGLICISCDPSGAPPRGPATLRSIVPPSSNAEVKPVLTRNLSADGERVFFESPDKLVGSDVNGDQECPLGGSGATRVPVCQDVYEWEGDGSGTCQQSGGCVYLLSSGTGSSPSYFGDASESGDDVFIFTRDPLVPQDGDGIQDVYDARVGGGLESQNQPPPLACTDTDTCHGPAAAPPGFGPLPSFAGPGNPKPKHRRKHRHKHRKHHRRGHQKHHGRAHQGRRAHR